ncbi:MAG TPA: hypothetical protein VF074_12295, partial [Pyrinomonadaceae bacterium]
MQAIRINSKYEDAIYNLGVVKLARKERDEAIVQYHRLKALNPELAGRLYQGLYKGIVLDLRNK